MVVESINWINFINLNISFSFRHTSALWSGNASYGLIPAEHWKVPSWIDPKRAAKARENLEEKKVLYATSVAYRQM